MNSLYINKEPNLDLNKLIELYKNDKLIPFIGSGFSKSLGLPSWEELIDWLGEKLKYEKDLFKLHGTPYQLAEYVCKNHPTIWNSFINEMIRIFNSDEAVKRRRKSIIHKALASLELKTIYTTNYDFHIEGALEDNGRNYTRLATIKDFLEFSENSSCGIVKFHGTLEEPDTIILSESRYFDRMVLEEAVDQRLRSDILSNSFLFIGYSFKDINIRYIWYKIFALKEQQKYAARLPDSLISLRPSYFITFDYDPIQPELLKNWNINVIHLDPLNKEKEIAELLKRIKKGKNEF